MKQFSERGDAAQPAAINTKSKKRVRQMWKQGSSSNKTLAECTWKNRQHNHRALLQSTGICNRGWQKGRAQEVDGRKNTMKKEDDNKEEAAAQDGSHHPPRILALDSHSLLRHLRCTAGCVWTHLYVEATSG